MAAHQAPPSLGFSRQEYWSGLPFPSPMYESEKSKWNRSVVSDSVITSTKDWVAHKQLWETGKSKIKAPIWSDEDTLPSSQLTPLCCVLSWWKELRISLEPVILFMRVLSSWLKWKWKWSRSVVSDSLRPRGLQPTRLLCPWDSPGKNTGVGCHFLLQGIFLTQGSNLGLLHCGQML